MSSGLKWIAGLVVIIIAGAALWYSGVISPEPTPAGGEDAASSQASSGLPTAQSDNSDAAVAQDSAAIDAQLEAMSQDSASIDEGLGDQSVEQSSF